MKQTEDRVSRDRAPEAPKGARPPWRTGLLLCILAFVLYNATLRIHYFSDCYPTEWLPVSILTEGDFDLDEVGFPEDAYWVVETGGRRYSRFPVFTSALAVPFYAAASIFLDIRHPYVVPILAKVFATALVALSGLFVYLSACRISRPTAAALATVTYLFGSAAFFTSQNLWQHNGGLLFVSIAIYALLRFGEGPSWRVVLGLAVGAAMATRPTNAILFVPLGIHLVIRDRWTAVAAFAWGLIPVVPALIYNAAVFGAPWKTGYSDIATMGWQYPVLKGLAGHLISPSRGIFALSPIYLLSLPALWGILRFGGWRIGRSLALGAALLILLYSTWIYWHGQHGYGYRMVVEALPILTLFLALAWKVPSRKVIVLGLLLAVSVGVQVVGVLGFDFSWETTFHPKGDPLALYDRRIWSVGDHQVVHYLLRGRVYYGKVACYPQEGVIGLEQRSVGGK